MNRFAAPKKTGEIDAGVESAKSIFFGVDGVGGWGCSKVYRRVKRANTPIAGGRGIARDRRHSKNDSPQATERWQRIERAQWQRRQRDREIAASG